MTDPPLVHRAIGAAAIGNIDEWGLVGCGSLWFLQEPNGRRTWGSAPAAGSDQEARELVAARQSA